MQAMEDIDRPFVCGGRSELASEGAAATTKAIGPRLSAGHRASLRELSDVCGSEVEVCADDLDYFGEPANAGFRNLLRRAAHLVGSKRATSNYRHQPMER